MYNVYVATTILKAVQPCMAAGLAVVPTSSRTSTVLSDALSSGPAQHSSVTSRSW